MKKSAVSLEPRTLRTRLIAVLTAIILLVVATFGMATLSAFDRAIAPELQNRIRLIGSILRSEVQRTLDLGIPFEALGGLDAYIRETTIDFSEIRRIAIIQGENTIIAEVARDEVPSLLQRSGLAQVAGIGSTNFSFPILIGNELVGEIKVEGSPKFVETRLREVFLDVAVLAIVALLLGVELALAVAAAAVWKPYGRIVRLLAEQVSGKFTHTIRVSGVPVIRRIAARLNGQTQDLTKRLHALPSAAREALMGTASGVTSAFSQQRMRYSDFNDVRLALFLFASGTEITASFLPIYAREARRPDWLSAELSAAAPLGLFLITMALLAPIGGAIVRRFGAHRVFVAATVPTAVSLVGMGLTDSLVALTLWRGLIGVFYALATIACQEYSIGAGGRGEATQSSSAFVGMIFGGAFCGSVLGGVIGGKFGFPVALYAGAFLALAAGGIGLLAMRGQAGEPAGLARGVAAAQVDAASGNSLAFWTLVAAVAIPMSATTAIFIWYLAPLGLSAQGNTPGDVARVVMLYYLAATLIGPLARSLILGRAGAMLPVITGAFLVGLVLFYFRATDDFWSFVAAVGGCGIGHALIRAPMTALAVRLAAGSGPKLSALRFGERTGALAGLTAVAFLLSSSDTAETLATLGAVTLAGGAVFAIIFVFSGRDKGVGQ